MKKHHYLIALIIVFAGITAALSIAYTARSTKRAAEQMVHVATTTDTVSARTTPAIGTLTQQKTSAEKPQKHINQHVSFSSSQALVTNVNSNNQFILSSTVEGKTSYIEVYVGKTGDCYMDYCKVPTQRTDMRNGKTWEFLGNPEHCDGTECSQPSALYRTKTASKDIYLIFFEYGPAIDKNAIFSTFVAT
jgi:hypothetical protein